LTLPFVPDWAEPVWHLFVVRHPNRYNLELHLQQNGIATLIHYPIPPHLSDAYSKKHSNLGSFPVAERLSKEILSLPMGSHISNQQIDAVTKAILENV